MSKTSSDTMRLLTALILAACTLILMAVTAMVSMGTAAF